MKIKRQTKIMELIKNRDVDTQEELLLLLRASGFECTQATVSRDIRELKIVKTSNGKGGYRYVAATLPTSEHIATKFAKILADTVKSVDQAMNLVVLRTYMAMASAACITIDAMNFEGILGSIAGDDTIVLITKSEEEAHRICVKLKEQIGAS